MRQTERYLEFGAASLFAREWIPDADPRALIFLVHGLGEHSGRYQHVAQHLTDHGFGVLAVDLPGHGRTSGPRGHARFDDLLRAVDTLLSSAASRWPTAPRFLYGHSLGGTIVINYALARGEQLAGAVVTSPLLLPAAPPPRWKLVVVGLAAKMAPTMTMANGLDVSALSRDLSVVNSYLADPLVHDRISATLANEMLAAGRSALERAASLAVPTLLVHGTADRITDCEASRRFAGAADGYCASRFWNGLYHETHNEPEWRSILDFTISWMDGRLSR